MENNLCSLFEFSLCVLRSLSLPHLLGGNVCLKGKQVHRQKEIESWERKPEIKLKALHSSVKLQALTAGLQNISFWAANPQPEGQDYLLWSKWASQGESISILQRKSDSTFTLNQLTSSKSCPWQEPFTASVLNMSQQRFPDLERTLLTQDIESEKDDNNKGNVDRYW